MEYFFIYFLLAVIAFVTILITWQSVRDLVTDTEWFRSTRMGMNYHNIKNGVEILTDEQYDELFYSGKLKQTIVIETE